MVLIHEIKEETVFIKEIQLERGEECRRDCQYRHYNQHQHIKAIRKMKVKL